MDQAISAVIGAIIFSWFAAGLAESIGSVPFFLIVLAVIGCVVYSTWEVIQEWRNPKGSNNSSK